MGADEQEQPTQTWVQRVLGGISPEKVKGLVKQGKLSPPKKIGSVGGRPAIALYRRDEVMALVGKITKRPYRNRNPTKKKIPYASLFQAFRNAMPFEEIVIKWNLHPDRVREARREYEAGFSKPPPAPPPPPAIESVAPKVKVHAQLEERRLHVKERELELRAQRLAVQEKNAKVRERIAGQKAFTERMVALASDDPPRKKESA
jgi:hypothetical protein